MATSLVAAFLLLLAAAPIERRLYVTGAKEITVHAVDDGHREIRRIELPDAGDYKGIAASPPLQRLFLSSHARDELIALDLTTHQEVWRKRLGKYVDSMAITPDGRTLVVPFRDEDCWRIVDAASGAIKATIQVGRGKQYDVNPIATIGPHNTWINMAGTRAYLEVLTMPYVFIADISSGQLIGKAGPFSKGVRPFAVSDDEKRIYASVDGLLGFEVAAGRVGDRFGGPMLRRVVAQPPPQRLAQLSPPPARKPHSTPSHGINVRPDGKEVWMVDGVYGYVYVYDITGVAPRATAAIPLFDRPEERPHPGWMTFGIDGRFAYPDGGAVIDTTSKKVVARIPSSEKLIEIDFRAGKAVAAGHR